MMMRKRVVGAQRFRVGNEMELGHDSAQPLIDTVERDERPRARRAAAANEAAYPVSRRLLTAREEVELATRARAGDTDARRLMMEANIRLVMSIARRYTCK